MLRNLLEPLENRARNLQHVSVLQGTKAYGSHIRPMNVPAREGRSEMREQPNFYWNQEDYLRAKQRGKEWFFSIFRPVLIVGYSQGSAMNVVPAIGVYAAMLKEAGLPLHYPGGPARVGQAVDAELLAKCIHWAGETYAARNETFNVANGDVYSWPNIWPAIAEAVGMQVGEDVPCSLEQAIRPREPDWARIRAKYDLVSPDLKSFVGLSFQYADYQLGVGRTTASPPSFSSTIKVMQAGFHEVIGTEVMFKKHLRVFQEKRLLPRP
jgi:nucleoside-diphosphate-sugar epimerase